MKAMILAAGMGTRLQPLTDKKPKVLIEVGGISMLQHQINYLKYYGVKEIIINVHHFADQVEEFIKSRNWNCRIEFSDEREKLLDTGGGLKKASWFFDDDKPFFLIGSDMYTTLNLNDLLSFHTKYNPIASLAVKKRKSSRDFLIDEDNFLCGWRNNNTSEEIISRKTNKKVSGFGFSVVHIINPELIKHIVNEEEVFSIVRFYLKISDKYPVRAFIDNKCEWFEFGRLENYYNNKLIEKVKPIINKFK